MVTSKSINKFAIEEINRKNKIELPSKCTIFLVSNNVAWEGNR